jgi:hypothetical protein
VFLSCCKYTSSHLVAGLFFGAGRNRAGYSVLDRESCEFSVRKRLLQRFRFLSGVHGGVIPKGVASRLSPLCQLERFILLYFHSLDVMLLRCGFLCQGCVKV